MDVFRNSENWKSAYVVIKFQVGVNGLSSTIPIYFTPHAECQMHDNVEYWCWEVDTLMVNR